MIRVVGRALAIATFVLLAIASTAQSRSVAFAGNPANGFSTFEPAGDVFKVFDTKANRLHVWLEYELYEPDSDTPWAGFHEVTNSRLTLDLQLPEGHTVRFRTCEGLSTTVYDGTNGTPNTCGRWTSETT